MGCRLFILASHVTISHSLNSEKSFYLSSSVILTLDARSNDSLFKTSELGDVSLKKILVA